MQGKRVLLWLLPLFAVAVITVPLIVTVEEGDDSVQPISTQPELAEVDGTDTVTQTAAMSAPAAIRLYDGRLSVALQSAPLHQVAAEVTRLSGIDIRFQGQHRPLLLNQQFEDYPLEQGLRTLLRETNSVFVYNEAGLLSSILLLPDGADASGGIEQAEAAGVVTTPVVAMDEPIERQLHGAGVQLMEQLMQTGMPGPTGVVNEPQIAPDTLAQVRDRLAVRDRSQLAGVGLLGDRVSKQDALDVTQ